MKIRPTSIKGVLEVETERVNDARGSFFRAFCDEELTDCLGDRRIQQVNVSQTNTAGAIRGLHFQRPPAAEMKLIRCLKGRVWDVALDLRAGSSTFLKWHAVELSEKNDMMLVVPEGYAHGFQVLDPESKLLYLHTAQYSPEDEGAIRCDDPLVGVAWPLAPTGVSEKDRAHPLLRPDFEGVVL